MSAFGPKRDIEPLEYISERERFLDCFPAARTHHGIKCQFIGRKSQDRKRAAFNFYRPMSNTEYYVIASRHSERPERWRWEIRRKSTPMGVKLNADGFQSESAAKFAGQRALDEFLSELAKEERRTHR